MGDQEFKSEQEKLIKLYLNIKEVNKKLSNGISSQLQEYKILCNHAREIIGELDAPIKIE